MSWRPLAAATLLAFAGATALLVIHLTTWPGHGEGQNTYVLAYGIALVLWILTLQAREQERP